MAGYLFGGSVVVEQVFALPGLGRLMVGAIAERNYPLVQASILLATLAFVLVNAAVDLLYAAIDPALAPPMRRNPLLWTGWCWWPCKPAPPCSPRSSPPTRPTRRTSSPACAARPPRTGSAPTISAATRSRASCSATARCSRSPPPPFWGRCLLGGTVGVLAAYRGGWPDRLAMRLMDVLFAFPIILLAIGIIAVLGPGAVSTGVAIGVVYIPIFARTLRAPALVLREAEYVTAARASGAAGSRILRRHMLPNLAPVILVQASLSLSTAILVEASLSFLGLGTQPPTASLGRMLAESRSYLLLSPWPAAFAGVAILLASLGFNLLGDGLQDRLDPRLR